MTQSPSADARSRLPVASFGVVALAALAGLAVLEASNGGDHAAAQAAAREPAEETLAGIALRPPPVADTLRYDSEYPTIPYSTGRRTDALAKLAARIERGEARLDYHPVRGYLDSLLAALDIDPASQTLVFSQTSLQSRLIRPSTPRAIYFNDDVYVAHVQNAPIEIASLDPSLGPVFYLLEQQQDAAPRFDTQLSTCLSCHDSYSLTGGGVPRFLFGSGYTGTTGLLVSHEGWILVSDRTPLKSRWGGWYVTGRHGGQVHLGNMKIKSLYDFDKLEELRVGNIDTLDALFDTKPYLTNKSDIVALLVFQHQADVQNSITRVSYDTRTALAAVASGELTQADAQTRIAEPVERLLHMMLFVDAVEYTAPISGLPAFTEQFARRAVRDAEGRSLRDFDLTRRLFRYPLSYLVYSEAFAALPVEAKSLFYRRLGEVLGGTDTSGDFAHLSRDERTAIVEILRATKPDFAASVAN
jgi:hypothetical protein